MSSVILKSVVARPPFSNVLNGKAALSPELAVRLEKAFGIAAKTLLTMQAAYNLGKASARLDMVTIERLPEPQPYAAKDIAADLT